MTAPNPACTVNSSPPPADVSAGSTVNGALSVTSGADFWSLTIIGCDEQNTVAAIAATLSVNTTSKTFSFTAPAATGSAVILKSVVGQVGGGLGRDSNNVAQPSFTATFKVNVKAANGNRVVAINETFEQDPTFGWVQVPNAAARASAGSSGVSSGGAITPSTLTWGAAAAPEIIQTQQASDIATNPTIISSQQGFATATGTHQIPGPIVLNIPAPTNGGATENGVLVERGTAGSGTVAVFLGQANGLANSGQIGLGSTAGPGNGGNYILANSGLLTVNAVSVGVRAAVANVNICDFLPANVNCYKPVQGGTSGIPFQWGQVAVTLANTGTTTLSAAQQQSVLLVMSVVTLVGATTLDFGAIIGNYVVDFSQVTLGGQTVTLKNGAGTVSATSLLLTKTLLTVSCRTAALINVG